MKFWSLSERGEGQLYSQTFYQSEVWICVCKKEIPGQSNNFTLFDWLEFFWNLILYFQSFNVKMSNLWLGRGVPELMLSIQPFCVHTILGGWGAIGVFDNAKKIIGFYGFPKSVMTKSCVHDSNRDVTVSCRCDIM